MEARDLPALNAVLNGVAAVLLFYGYRLIQAGDRIAHRKAMQAAFGVSVVFLICYLIYHAEAGSVPFRKEGPVRYFYFTVLISHVVLAATVPVLASLTLWRGLRGEFDKHKRLAKVTLPIWMYVSVTGVVVYLMLYQM